MTEEWCHEFDFSTEDDDDEIIPLVSPERAQFLLFRAFVTEELEKRARWSAINKMALCFLTVLQMPNTHDLPLVGLMVLLAVLAFGLISDLKEMS